MWYNSVKFVEKAEEKKMGRAECGWGIKAGRSKRRLLCFGRAAAVSASFFIILFAVINPLKALALDERYTNLAAWSQCQNQQIEFNYHDGYEGITEYFFDGSVFYCHISFSAENMDGENNTIQINASLNYDDGEKCFGITDGSTTADSREYTVSSAFYYNGSLGGEICFIIEPKTKTLQQGYSIDLEIKINTASYELITDLKSPVLIQSQTEEKETATDKTTTKKSADKAESTTAKSSSAEPTTKFKYTAGAQAQGATKFNTEGNASKSEQIAQGSEENAQSAENGGLITAEQAAKEVSFSTASRIMFIIAGALAAVGIIMLLKAIIADAIDKRAEQLAATDTDNETDADNKTDTDSAEN